MNNPLPKVYADFNALGFVDEDGGLHMMELTGYGTLGSLARQGLRLTEGLRVIFYEPNDIEALGIARFSYELKDPAGRRGAWYAEIEGSAVVDSMLPEERRGEHPCIECGYDFVPYFKTKGQSYEEECPQCGASVMAPLAPPNDAT